MGITQAAKYGGIGFIADRIFGTGWLGTLAGAAFGGLFQPDAGEMSTAYDKRKATLGDTLKDFLGYDMSDTLFGSASKSGRTADEVRPNRERAERNAAAREKKDGLPWGKILLGGAAALFGINLLDNFALGNGFGMPAYGAIGPWGGGGGILPMALTGLLGLGAWNMAF